MFYGTRSKEDILRQTNSKFSFLLLLLEEAIHLAEKKKLHTKTPNRDSLLSVKETRDALIFLSRTLKFRSAFKNFMIFMT